MGTRFLVAEECSVHPNYKEKVIKQRHCHHHHRKRLGHPVAQLKNRLTREYIKAEYSACPTMSRKAGNGGASHGGMEGDLNRGCFLCGQVAGMVTKQQPAADISGDNQPSRRRMREADRWIVK
jgi:enoyl-[acyl-carrier protein] reductase II